MSVLINTMGTIASLVTAALAGLIVFLFFIKWRLKYTRHSSRRGALLFYSHGLVSMVAAIFLNEKFLLITGAILTVISIPLIIYTMQREWVMTMSIVTLTALILVVGILLVATNVGFDERAANISIGVAVALLFGAIAFEVWQMLKHPKLLVEFFGSRYTYWLLGAIALTTSLWALFWIFYLVDEYAGAAVYIEIIISGITFVAAAVLLSLKIFVHSHLKAKPGAITTAMRELQKNARTGTIPISSTNKPAVKAVNKNKPPVSNPKPEKNKNHQTR